MESEYEYSEQIRYYDWPAEWRLDKDDEEQLERDLQESKRILQFLQLRKEQKEIGTKSSSVKVEKQKRLVRRGIIRKRQNSNG